MNVPLVLASTSPRRRELLTDLRLSFTVDPSGIEEPLDPGLDPRQQVTHLAEAKAAEVANRRPHSTPVLAADTLVVLDGAILEKPAGPADAARMLLALRGRPHQVATGVAVTVDQRRAAACRVTTVHMRDYAGTEIDAYIARGEPFDKAGGYAIQDLEFHPVERIEGCYCNVVGLPLALTLRLLRGFRLQTSPLRPGRCATCPDWPLE